MKTRAERRKINVAKWITRLKLWMRKDFHNSEEYETYKDLKETRYGYRMKKSDVCGKYAGKKYDIKETRKRNIANRTIPKEELETIKI